MIVFRVDTLCSNKSVWTVETVESSLYDARCAIMKARNEGYTYSYRVVYVDDETDERYLMLVDHATLDLAPPFGDYF